MIADGEGPYTHYFADDPDEEGKYRGPRKDESIERHTVGENLNVRPQSDDSATEPTDAEVAKPDTKKSRKKARSREREFSNRAKSVVNMKIEGVSFVDIAEKLDLKSATEARTIYEEALSKIHDPEMDWRSQKRIAKLRLEAILAPQMRLATNPKARDADNKPISNFDRGMAADRALKVVDRIIKLEGIDAPQMHTIVSPKAAQLEALVQGVIERSMDPDAPREADMDELEAEVIEDAVLVTEEGETDDDD